jgi:hypothetical protein
VDRLVIFVTLRFKVANEKNLTLFFSHTFSSLHSEKLDGLQWSNWMATEMSSLNLSYIIK